MPGWRGIVRAAVALLLASSPCAASAGDGAGGATSSFAVEIRVDATGPTARYVHDPQAGFMPNPAVTVDVAGQARAAYLARAATMFPGAGQGEPALQLEIRVAAADVDGGPGRWRAVVRHEVVARGRDGAEIARWATVGEGDVVGFEAEAVTAAFARAARSAARELEQRFDASPDVARWRTSSGYGPPIAAAPPEAAPGHDADPTARPPWSGYVDGALGFATSQTPSRNVDFGLRAGATHRFVYLQLAVDRWASAESPGDFAGPFAYLTRLSAWMVGAEAGLVHRLDSRLEVRGGVGAYWLEASAAATRIAGAYYDLRDVTVDRGGVAGSVGMGLYYVTPPQRSMNARGRIGVDARRLFGTTLTFEPLGGDITVGRWLATVAIGLEFPAVAKR